MNLLLWDTETTGFPRKLHLPLSLQPEMTQFAGVLINLEDPEAEEWLEFKCRTKKPMPKEIEKYCGFKDSDLDGHLPFEENLPKLESFISRTDGWIAHNLKFDKTILAIELARMGKNKTFLWPKKELCTMFYSKKTFASGRHNLRDLHYRFFTGRTRQKHNAKADVQMLLDIVRVLITENNLKF